jgi:hypothetical protein
MGHRNVIDHIKSGIFRLAWSAVRAANRYRIAKHESIPPGVVDAAAEIQTIMAAQAVKSQREAAQMCFRYRKIGVPPEQIIEYFLKHPERSHER